MQKRDFSLHGAVDLAARAAAAKKQQERAAQAGAGGQQGGRYSIEVTDETFTAEVIERSLRVPVMVAFVVENEPSCDALMADLEKLAAEGGGSWYLAKVDIEINQQLQGYLQQLRVQRLPFVGVIVRREMIPFLNSVPPEAELRAAAGELFAALREQGLMGEPSEEAQEPQGAVDPAHAAAEAAVASGDYETAAEAFRAVLAQNPRDAVAKYRLAFIEIILRVEGYDQEQVAADPLKAADVQLLQGDPEGAFGRVLAVVRASSGEERDAARVHLLGLFETLPADDERVAKARRALQAALF